MYLREKEVSQIFSEERLKILLPTVFCDMLFHTTVSSFSVSTEPIENSSLYYSRKNCIILLTIRPDRSCIRAIEFKKLIKDIASFNILVSAEAAANIVARSSYRTMRKIFPTKLNRMLEI